MLVTAGLLAASLFGSDAQASCTADSTVMWMLPSTGQYSVPPDAVFRALVGEGSSPATAFSAHLERQDGTEIEASVEITEHPGNDPFEVRYLHTLVPAETLEEGVRYSFVVEHESGDDDLGRAMSAVVSSEEPDLIEGVPGVTVISSYDSVGDGTEGCDYGEMRTFELLLDPAQGDETGRSVLHLYRMQSESSAWHYVRAFRVDEQGEAQTTSVSFDRDSDWGSCFAVVQEDIAGNQSEVSLLGCAAETLSGTTELDENTGPEAHLDSGSGTRGCSTVGAAAGWLGLGLAGLLGLRRRE